MVAFGLAPAIVAYQWGVVRIMEYGHYWGRFGWLACFFYAAAAALRLARFNARAATADKRYFEGLPSPSAAAIVAAFVWFSQRLAEPRLDGLIAGLPRDRQRGRADGEPLRLPELQAVRSRPAHQASSTCCSCRCSSSLIAIDPPTMLLSMFGTYALSAPVLWVGPAHCAVWCAAHPHAPVPVSHGRTRSERQRVPGCARDRDLAAVAARRRPRPQRPLPPVTAAGRLRPPRGARRAARQPAAPEARGVGGAARRGARVHAAVRCTSTRTQGVFGVGPKRADWLVIGEAPGAEEDRRGEPFVGARASCSMPCCAPSGLTGRRTSTSRTC